MKEKLIISTREFENSQKIGNLYFIGDNLSKDSNYACFQDGYVTDRGYDKSQIIEIFEKEGIKGFNKFNGQYNIIVYCKIDDRLYFTNDFFAPLSVYYYHDKNGFFVLSNSFWQVVNLIKPEEKDIDQEVVAQMAIYGMLLDKNTIIRNLKVADTASNYQYDLRKDKLSSIKYDDYSSFVETPMSLDEAADQFNQAIIEAANYVKNRHKEEKIGVSVSGGLDSRVVPALFGDKAEYFVITGPQRVKKWAKPYNYTYIDEIAKAYGIKITKINQVDTPYEEKLFLEVKNSPVRAENICKIISKSEVNFDILFTSGSPDLLSSARTMYRNGWSMWDIMEKYQGHRYIKKSKQRSLKSILSFIFVKRPNTYQVYNCEYEDFYPVKIMDKEMFYERAHDRIEHFTRMKENSQDAIMIENYDLPATDSSMGAFESLAGQVKFAYTYFYPWAYKALKHVPFEYINQRHVLKRVIEKYYPQVANIASEHSIEGIHNENRTSSWKIIKSLVRKQIGGDSSFGRLYPSQKARALQLFDEKCCWYDCIFDGNTVRNTIDYQSDIFSIHLKIKTLLRTIENKDWEKYLD